MNDNMSAQDNNNNNMMMMNFPNGMQNPSMMGQSGGLPDASFAMLPQNDMMGAGMGDMGMGNLDMMALLQAKQKLALIFVVILVGAIHFFVRQWKKSKSDGSIGRPAVLSIGLATPDCRIDDDGVKKVLIAYRVILRMLAISFFV